jgi:methylated-DNA-[protein]-cysteine S-methyltransferase
MMASDLRALVTEAPTWGWIGLVASAQGLRLLGLPKRTEQAALRYLHQHYRDIELTPDDPFLREVARQVQAYLAGELREFSVGLDLRGRSSFELSVWAAISRISYGQTRTYTWIADQVGEGRGAAQAAGAAVGSNPVPIVVPCHRVIGADGSLHGFAGGLAMKARLLALESGQGALELGTEG